MDWRTSVKESWSIIRISTHLSLWMAFGLTFCGFILWGADSPKTSDGQSDLGQLKESSSDFDLPEFMKPGEALDSAKIKNASLASNEETAAEKLDIVPNSGEFTNNMTVGDIIVSPRQKLLKQPIADIRLEEVPIRDALRYLAEASGINYVLPDLDTEKVTVNMHMPPFRAMEILANNFGLGIYEEDGLWFIRKKDKAQYFAKIYKLHNIQLGQSTSGSGTTGTTGASSTNTATGTNANTTTNSTTNSTNGTGSTSGSNVSGGGSSSTSGTDVSGQVVITTLQQILGIDLNFGGTIGADGKIATVEGSSDTSNAAKKDNNTTTASENTYVSYNADANTLFIIATATQHQWVEQYLKAIDNPTNNIAIEAMFLETSRTPSSQMGFDWSKASSLTLQTNQTPLGFGTIKNPTVPLNTAIISTQTFSASLTAFQKTTDSQIAHYPSVVTQNGRQVQIQTTQSIPLSAVQRLVSGDTANSATVGVQDLGTQQIGTTITITPRQINDSLVQLNISIQISTQSGNSTDPNTNRVATNNSTYTGTVNVPQGYTLAIGGLERIADAISKNKLPGLGDIPLFGFLFKYRDTSGSSRTNIYMFITPTILKEDKPDGSFMRHSEGLSHDWIDTVEAQHRAWRRDRIDPETKEAVKKAGKQ